MRRFQLHRDRDVSGVSGEGVVAEGVQWSDGWVTTHWLGYHASTVTWHLPGMVSPEHVHGHAGATRIVWLDGEES